MCESDQKRERESEFGAKRICVNNRMVFKFRFIAFPRNCMVTENQIDQTKYRTR